MALFFDIVFENRSADPDDGNIVIQADNEGVASQEWEVRVELIAPSGAIFRAKPVAADATIDEDVPGVLPVLTEAIPTDGTGNNYQGGNYKIRLYVTGIAGPTIGAEIMYEYTYYYEPVVSVDHFTSSLIELSTNLNCLNGEITIQDETDYTGWTNTSRTLTIVHPTIPGIATPADDTTTDSTLTVVATHINTTYQTSLVSIISRSATGIDLGGSHTLDIANYQTANLSSDVVVDCDNDLCDSLSCLAQKFDVLEEKACARGGWSQLTASERGDYEFSLHLFTLAKLYFDCGNNIKFRYYLAKAKANLDCNCGCNESTAPTPLITVGGTESTAIVE